MDSNYTKAGYLTEPFKIFHLKDEHKLNIDFHYHDFHKILIHLHGNVSSVSYTHLTLPTN